MSQLAREGLGISLKGADERGWKEKCLAPPAAAATAHDPDSDKQSKDA